MSQLESRKMELRDKSRKESARKSFLETYDALVKTLIDTYKECKEMQLESKDMVLINEWLSDFQSHGQKLRDHDQSLMLDNIQSLTKLMIPQLWVQGKFSSNSKKYIWQYLNNLYKFATTFIGLGKSSTDPRDIEPPSTTKIPDIKQIYDELPKNMLEKVKNIADKYSQKIENGETTINSLQFKEISNELFSQINPEEMQEMVSSVGNMLQGIIGQDGSVSDLFGKPRPAELAALD